MTLPVRLQKITQNLSPLQRVTLLLQASSEGRQPDPELSRFDDPQQATAFRRFLALHYTSNAALGPRCDAIHIVSQDLEAMAVQVRLLEQAAGVLEEEHGLTPPKRIRAWRKAPAMEVNEFLRSLAREAREGLIQALALRWQELRAVEVLWQELATEFGGTDPVDPQFRVKAAEISDALRALAAEMNAKHRLVEPDNAVVIDARRAVDDAFERLEPLL